MFHFIGVVAVIGLFIAAFIHWPWFRGYVIAIVSTVAGMLGTVIFVQNNPQIQPLTAYIIATNVCFFGFALLGRGLLAVTPKAKAVAQGLFWGACFSGIFGIWNCAQLKGYF